MISIHFSLKDAKKFTCALDNVQLTGADSIDDAIILLGTLIEEAIEEQS